MKKIVTAIALCLLALGSASVALAQQRPGSLRGQVLDELGGALKQCLLLRIHAHA